MRSVLILWILVLLGACASECERCRRQAILDRVSGEPRVFEVDGFMPRKKKPPVLETAPITSMVTIEAERLDQLIRMVLAGQKQVRPAAECEDRFISILPGHIMLLWIDSSQASVASVQSK